MRKASIWVLLATFFGFYYFLSSDLPILSEAREYLKHGGYITDYWAWFKSLFVPAGYNTRYISMLGFHMSRKWFGLSQVGLNSFQLAIVALAGYFLYRHTLQIFKNLAAALTITALWLFSLPTLSAILWQAVNHDKTAAVFVFSALTAAKSFLDSSSPSAALKSNIVLTLLLIGAYNAKESSFFLMPLILMQYIMYSRQWHELKRNLLNIILPIVFSIYYVGGYFILLKPDMKSHVLHKVTLYALSAFSNSLVNLYDSGWPLTFCVLVVFLAAGFLFSGWLIRDKNAVEFQSSRRDLGYSLMFFLLSLAPVLKAQFQPPYYMFMPLAGFLFVITACFRYLNSLMAAVGWGRKAVPAAAAVLAVMLPVNTARHLAPGGDFYKLLQASRNFNKTYREIASRIPLTPETAFVFIYPAHIDYHFFFLRGKDGLTKEDPGIINYIYNAEGDYQVEFAPYVELGAFIRSYASLEKKKCIIMDDKYNILAIH